MELRQGYKQTEVGVIPQDWGLLKLENNFTLKARIGWQGLTTKEYLTSGNYSLVTGTDFHDGYINWESCVFVERIRFDQDKNIQLKVGDVLVTKDGTIGKVAYVDRLPNPTTLNSGVFVLRPKNNGINNRFFYTILMSFYFDEFLNKITAGSTITHLYQKDFIHFNFVLPSIKEQTAIANALSDMDALISQTEKLIEKKKAIKLGAMQELLKPKEGWDKVTIGNVINVARGGSPRPIQEFLTSDANGINWIKIGDTDIESKYIDSANEKIIPEGEKNSRKVNVGDFLLSNSMSFGRPYILNIDGCIHDGWLVLQNYNAHFDREFLYYSLMSSYVLKQYLRLAAGSGVLNLNKEIVKGVTLLKPRDLKEQRSIADILSTMDKDIDLQIKKLNKLKHQKQGMMQALLTGKIRLVS